jgi:hypothetical protein
MTIAHQIARSKQALDHADRDSDFVLLAKALVAGTGNRREAADYAARWGASARVQSILKAAVAPGGLGSDSAWGSELAAYETLASAFAESLRFFGLFDAMLADGFIRVPINARLGLVTTGATGDNPSEASPKLISVLALGTNQSLAPKKSTAIVALTDELARSLGSEALIGNELKSAAAVAVDTAFLTIALSGVSGQASAGSTLANITTDLSYLAANVSTGARSKLFLATTPALCRKLAFKSDTVGARAFAQLGPQGGMIANVPVIVSDAINAGDVLLLDATGFAGAAAAIALDVSRTADIQLNSMHDSPVTASTVLQSLWQSNLRGLRAERYWSAVRLRSNSVARITGAAY